jgi:hypothetical protein
MPLLDAALALALTLLALAGLTTMLIELGHRILRLKAKQFKRMIDDFVQAEIAPLAVRKFLKSKKDEATGLLPPAIAGAVAQVAGPNAAVDQLTDDQLREILPALAGAGFGEADKWVRDAIAKLLANSAVPTAVRTGVLRAVEEMDTDELLKRLGELELFQDIKSKGQQAMAVVVARVETTYEEIAAAARDFFTRRAKIVSLVAGVIVAFCLNVDGYRIFRLYLKDPVSAQRVIAEQDKLVAGWQAAQAALDKALEEMKARPAGTPGTDADLTAIRERIAAMEGRVAALRASGIPIGYGSWEGPPPEAPWWRDVWHYAAWIVSVLATGLLIGLGGPFWYDIAIKLSQARHIVRGSGSTVPTSGDETRRAAEGRLLTLKGGVPVAAAAAPAAAAGPPPIRARNLKAFGGAPPLSKST